MATTKNRLPDCGLYRTTRPLPGHEDSIPAGILVNFHNAKKYRTGILVEGWFDVYGLGAMSIPVLGKTFTSIQQRLFASEFGKKKKRSGVMLLDPEEFEKEKTKRMRKELADRMDGNLACIKLPKGTDPGSLDRKFMRDFIVQEAKSQGVKVWFEKVGT